MYNGNFGLPAPPEDHGGVTFTEESHYPCPECAAQGIETLMLYNPNTKEWGCPKCRQEDPYCDLDEIIESLAGHLMEVA